MRLSRLRMLMLLLMMVAVFLQSVTAKADADPLNGPWDQGPDKTIKQQLGAAEEGASVASGFFHSLLSFFQQVISPVDGDRCPSYPTCSAYSSRAYSKHGALLGTLMTVDRLIHEASEAHFSPTIRVHGVRRIYDPLTANEFWKRPKEIQPRR